MVHKVLTSKDKITGKYTLVATPISEGRCENGGKIWRIHIPLSFVIVRASNHIIDIGLP